MSPRRAPRALRAVGAATAVLFAFPAAYLVFRNFTSGAEPLALIRSGRTLGPFWRTVQLSVLVSVSASTLGVALAWLTVRTNLPGRRLWRALLPVPLVFPTFIGAAAFRRTLNPGGLAHGLLETLSLDGFELRGLFGAWLVLTLFTFPYVFLPVAARLHRLPGSLEESARVLGDTAPQAFRRIVLPQISGAVGAGGLLVFLYTISDFGAVQLMRYDTLTRAIETNYLARPAVAFALSLILLVLAAAVVLGERRFSSRNASVVQTRTLNPVSYDLGPWRIPTLAFVTLAAFMSVGAPMVAILDWAGDGLLRATRSGRPLTIESGEVLEAARNTLESSALAAVAAVLVVLPVAFLVGRYRDRIGTSSHAVIIATFAMPGILIALALRFWVLRAGFAGDLLYDLLYDSKALLILAYVIRFGSLAMGITLIAVQTVPDRMLDAASTLGAGRVRQLATIELPLMTPGLLAAVGMVLLSTMKELPISLIIAPFGYPTLTTRIFGSFEDAFVAEAGIMAVVLVAMSSLLTWLLILRQSNASFES